MKIEELGKKNVIFISGVTIPESPTGIRHEKIIRCLQSICNLRIVRIENKSIDTLRNELDDTKIIKKFIKKIIKFGKRFILTDEYFIFRNSLKKSIQKEFANQKIDTVILGVVPHSLLPLAKFIKRNYKNSKLIIDISDPFSANASRIYRTALKNLFAYHFEKYFLSYADTIITLNKEIADFYKEDFHLKSDFHIIEQGFDKELLHRRQYKIKHQESNNSKAEISLIYSGSFYLKLRDPGELFKAVELSDQNIIMRIYGGGFNQGLEININNLKKVQFLPYVNQEKLFEEYSKSDILVFLDNQFGIQVPAKTLEIMIFGKPILFISSHECSPSLEYLKNYPGLISVKNEYSSIIKGIDKCIQNKDIEFGSEWISRYAWENLLQELENLI